MKTLLLLIILFISIYISTNAQVGYYISREETLSDTLVFGETMPAPVSLNREDVKAIGMGKTQVALGRTFNAMMYNPAFLATKKFQFEAINVQLSLPPQTYDAANFLKDNMKEFKQAFSLREVWQGVNDLKTANNLQAQLNALSRIQNGLRFPRNLLNEVVGSSTDPKIHGLRILPGLSLQTGNFGFSLYAISQSGFQMQQSPIIDALLEVDLPEDVNNPDEIARAIISLEGPLNAVINAAGDVTAEVYPVAYSFSIFDVVGAAGYGHQFTSEFSAGINLKLIHRRFSTKRVVIDKYDKILTEVRKDLNSYVTGFTFDLGAMYQFSSGTNVALSLQNIIPVQNLSSHMRATVPVSYYDYDRDQQGRIIVNGQDTALVSYSRNVTVDLPFELELPVVANLGVSQRITKDFDAALDFIDLAQQEDLYEKFTERIRVGTEYRLNATTNFGIAGRLGFADDHPTFGLGLNIFRVLQIDAAYAWDSFVDTYSYFAQLKIGW